MVLGRHAVRPWRTLVPLPVACECSDDWHRTPCCLHDAARHPVYQQMMLFQSVSRLDCFPALCREHSRLIMSALEQDELELAEALYLQVWCRAW